MSLPEPGKPIVIQLQNEHDAHQLLWLVQKEAGTGLIYNDYWANLAHQIITCIEQQTQGGFFQCSACTEEVDPCHAG